VLDCDGFENLNNFRKEGIGNFRNDETENPAASRNQRPRLGIWIISKFLDYTPDPLRQGRVDGGNAVDSAGDSGG
jgi:hypothetical protein